MSTDLKAFEDRLAGALREYAAAEAGTTGNPHRAREAGTTSTRRPVNETGTAGTPRPANETGRQRAATDAEAAGEPRSASEAGTVGTPRSASEAGTVGTPRPASEAGTVGTPRPASEAGTVGTPRPASEAGATGERRTRGAAGTRGIGASARRSRGSLRGVGAARRRSGATVLALAAAVVAVGVLALPERGGGPAPATAAELLATAARAAEREAPLPAGRYLYVRSTFTTRIGIAPVHAGTQETWTRADGSGRTRVRTRSGRVVEDARQRAGALRIGTETITPAELRSLDAAGLERLVARQAARAPGFDPAQLRAFAAYRILHDVLATPSSAALRAQAYRTLAAAPGLRLLQRAGDTVTVAARVGDVEFRATVDVADGRVLTLERILLRRSAQIPGPAGVVDRWVVVERRATVSPG